MAIRISSSIPASFIPASLPNKATLDAAAIIQAAKPEMEADIACLTALVTAAGVDVAVMADGSYVFTQSSREPRPADTADLDRLPSLDARLHALIDAILPKDVDNSYSEIQDIQPYTSRLGELFHLLHGLNKRTLAIVFRSSPSDLQTEAAEKLLLAVTGIRLRLERDVAFLIVMMKKAGITAFRNGEGFTFMPSISPSTPEERARLANFPQLLASIAQNARNYTKSYMELLPQTLIDKENPDILQEVSKIQRGAEDLQFIFEHFMFSPIKGITAAGSQITPLAAIVIEGTSPEESLLASDPIQEATRAALETALPLDEVHEADVDCMYRLLSAAGIDAGQLPDGTFLFGQSRRAPAVADEDDLLRFDQINARLDVFGNVLSDSVDAENEEIQRIRKNAEALETLVIEFQDLPNAILKIVLGE